LHVFIKDDNKDFNKLIDIETLKFLDLINILYFHPRKELFTEESFTVCDLFSFAINMYDNIHVYQQCDTDQYFNCGFILKHEY